MDRKATLFHGQTRFATSDVPTAPCVPAIRIAVEKWRAGGYDGTSGSTRVLLNHWFRRDHIDSNGRPFAYHRAQREAIETLIYLYEVVRVRRLKTLVENFAGRNRAIRLLQHDDIARYCVKMATGVGKTKVMALSIVWHYFNSVIEGNTDFAKTTLLVAPNLIVFERLKTDFELGRIFRVDPLVPPELADDWEFECHVRGEGERSNSRGSLFLTNIQQLYKEEVPPPSSTDPLETMLGPQPPPSLADFRSFADQIVRMPGPLLLLNDEAHHIHDEKSEWNEVIRRLNTSVRGGIAAELDFSATPRYAEGGLFSWTVFDYPLREAIADGIVKRPVKGITREVGEGKSAIASRRYSAYLTAGVERWKEYRSQLARLGKRPILFIMLSSTAEADDVGDYLRSHYPAEFGGIRLQVIHTDRNGEVSADNLELARQTVREVDDPASPVNAIVSVLMLREGWDVQNVTVVVGLRPYSAKAKILPEQTIGRGLRLMFRDLGRSEHFVERVDIIGNRAFMQFVDELDREEGLALETFRVGADKLEVVTVFPVAEKGEYDIEIPLLSPALVRKRTLASEIESLDIMTFDSPPIPMRGEGAEASTFRYLGYDLLTLEKLVDRRYYLPEPQTSQEVIAYYAKRISEELRLPGQFAALVPKVREFLELKAFGLRIDIDTPEMLKILGSNPVQYVTIDQFVKGLRRVVTERKDPELIGPGVRLSQTEPFPFSRETFAAHKSVFNLVACANPFEKEFAEFLDQSEDVQSFAKIPERLGFSVEYTDSVANLRHYFPDFVVATTEGSRYLVETKGREDIDVAYKDRAASNWCANATRLTGVKWVYLKVQQAEWKKLRPESFEELLVLSRT
nr:DEAD/DEAH box helicase family protein [Ferrimicrobium acidiphilum]